MNRCIAVNHHTTTKEGEFSLKMGQKKISEGKAAKFCRIFWPKETLIQEVSTLNHIIGPGRFFMVLLNIQKFAPIRLVINGSRFSVHEPKNIGGTVRKCRLVFTFSGGLCNENPNIMD